MIAPAGYGKSTLLANWAAQEARPVAWLALTDLDNDSSRLLEGIAGACDTVGLAERPLGGRLPSGADRLLAGPLPRFLRAVADAAREGYLVLDDVHLLVDQDAIDILGVLLDRLPPNLRIHLAGRSAAALPLARLRAHRRLREIDSRDLALDPDEAAELVRLAGVSLEATDVHDITVRTEGWPAGIYLAALGRAAGSPHPVGSSTSGLERHIADYLRTEVGRGLTDDDVTFLARTSVLDNVSPGAAEAITGLAAAQERLERLMAANQMISPAPGDPGSYRYHTILREYFREELERRQPAAVAALHGQAAAYYASAGAPELAVEHALASGDKVAAGRYLGVAALPMYQAGYGTQVMRWADTFDAQELERAPLFAALAGWIYALLGRPARADLVADVVEQIDPSTLGPEAVEFRSIAGVMEAIMARHGVAGSITAAARVADDGRAGQHWRSVASALLGTAYLAATPTQADAADAAFAEALDRALPQAASLTMTALALRAAIRLDAGNLAEARSFARRAREVLDTHTSQPSVLALPVYASDARTRALTGDIEGARAALVQAQLVRPLATYALPVISVLGLLDIARAYLVLSDPAGAQIALRQAEDIVRRRPAVGGLVDQLIELNQKLHDARAVLAGSSTLTTAELRVLPLLPTYLSFEEIGERLHVSRNTVKTHAMSIYGKLWASSRGEAVERAVELGLLEPYPVLSRRDGDDEPA